MRWKRVAWIGLASLVVATVVYAAGQLLYVQVTTARVRSSPNFLTGKQVATLRYGQAVEKLETRGTWVRVRFAGDKTGWVSASALNEKKIALRAGDEDVGAAADQEELVLAGRGFNQDVEEAYQHQHRLDYRWVDYMETSKAFRVSGAEMRAFLREGGMTGAEGGAR